MSKPELADASDILVGADMIFTHEDGDPVLVSCYNLYPDVWIDEEGADRILDGETVYCLCMGTCGIEWCFPARSPPPRLDISLVLKRSPVIHGVLERIGVMLSNAGSVGFRDALESIVKIVQDFM